MKPTCRSCRDALDPRWRCPMCQEAPNQCPECHRETVHGKIPPGTVSFTGGGSAPRGTLGVDGDPDAFRRSE